MLFVVKDTTNNYATVRLPEKEIVYWANDFKPDQDIETVDEAIKTLEEMDFVVDRLM